MGGDSNFIAIDRPDHFIGLHADEPAIHGNNQGVENRGLAGSVVADEKVESWIQFKDTRSKTCVIR